MRGGTNITALYETMAGKGIVLIGGHQAQYIAGTDQVLIMADLAVLFIMVHHMTDTGVHSMEGTAGIKKNPFFSIWLLNRLNNILRCK